MRRVFATVAVWLVVAFSGNTIIDVGIKPDETWRLIGYLIVGGFAYLAASAVWRRA